MSIKASTAAYQDTARALHAQLDTAPGVWTALESRDEQWFSTLWEQMVDSVYRYAWSLTRDSAVAEDVTAETFLRVWRARHSYRGDGAITSWVLTIARNCATTALNTRREDVDLALVPDLEEPASTPGDVADDRLEAIQAALEDLTGVQQQVIFLRFFKDMSHEEVAQALGRQPAAVRAAQFRALNRIRRLLEASAVS